MTGRARLARMNVLILGGIGVRRCVYLVNIRVARRGTKSVAPLKMVTISDEDI